MTERIEGVEILKTVYGGRGPGGMRSRVIRELPSGRITRIDFNVTDGKADPQLTELTRELWADVEPER